MPERRALIIAQWALAALATLFALLTWATRLSTQAGAAIYFNADVIYPASVVEDVLIRGHSFREWHLTPAPYLFPDLMFAAISRLLLGTLEWAQYLSALTQVATLVVLLALVARQLVPTAGPLAISLGALLLTLGLNAGHEPLSQLWLPAYHCGTVLSALLATWLALRRGSLWNLGALCVLSGASDSLFAVGWAIPALIIAATWERAARAPWLCGGLTGIAGVLLARWVLPYRRDSLPRPSVSALPEAFVRAWADWATFDPVLRWGLPLLSVAMLIIVLTTPRLRTVATLALLSAVGTIGAVIATSNFVDTGWSRYLLWPMISAGLVALLLVGDSPRVQSGVVIALGALTIGFAQLSRPSALPSAAERTVAECLDALGAAEQVDLVIADYWHAKPLTLFAKRVTVVSFEPMFANPDLAIISRQWFRPPVSTGLIIAYGLDRSALEAAVGVPSAEVLCGTERVLVYRADARERLLAHFHQRVRAAIGGRLPR